MKVSFKEDDAVYSLDKSERDDIRHVRNLTAAVARLQLIPEAAAASEGLTKILGAIDEDGTIGTRSLVNGGVELKQAAQGAGGKAGDK